MKFVTGERGTDPEKNLPRFRYVRHETHVKWQRRELRTPAVEGERLTACTTEPLPEILGPTKLLLCRLQSMKNDFGS